MPNNVKDRASFLISDKIVETIVTQSASSLFISDEANEKIDNNEFSKNYTTGGITLGLMDEERNTATSEKDGANPDKFPTTDSMLHDVQDHVRTMVIGDTAGSSFILNVNEYNNFFKGGNDKFSQRTSDLFANKIIKRLKDTFTKSHRMMQKAMLTQASAFASKVIDATATPPTGYASDEYWRAETRGAIVEVKRRLDEQNIDSRNRVLTPSPSLGEKMALGDSSAYNSAKITDKIMMADALSVGDMGGIDNYYGFAVSSISTITDMIVVPADLPAQGTIKVDTFTQANGSIDSITLKGLVASTTILKAGMGFTIQGVNDVVAGGVIGEKQFMITKDITADANGKVTLALHGDVADNLVADSSSVWWNCSKVPATDMIVNMAFISAGTYEVSYGFSRYSAECGSVSTYMGIENAGIKEIDFTTILQNEVEGMESIRVPLKVCLSIEATNRTKNGNKGIDALISAQFGFKVRQPQGIVKIYTKVK